MDSSQWMNFATKVKRFDAYPKTMEDFRIKTHTGAVVTIISGIAMFFLFVLELKYYLTTEVQPELFVDFSRGNKLDININLTFPKLPCAYVSLDAMDVSGQRQINVQHTMFKQKLNQDGTPVPDALETIVELGDNKTVSLDADRCESCFGAETPELNCCNTCSDVKEAYRRKGWAFPIGNNIPQCERDDPSEKIVLTGGCLLHGHLEVNRVAGNFHISPGKSYEVGHVHVHELVKSTTVANLTHYINHLSFGTTFPGQELPLDGIQVISDEATLSAYQYYIKIVPTTYVDLSGNVLKTNQFSITRHKKVISADGGDVNSLPGIFMSYEFSPMMVKYVEHRKSFFHFLTSVCAIIGGIFTVAGLVDSFIYHGAQAINKKMELGKAT